MTERRVPFAATYAVPIDGGRLYVARSGPAPADAAAVVVAVHGITASHLAWQPVARLLLDQPDLCLLAPDLRGRGRSAGLPPHKTFAAHVADLVGALDCLGIERTVLAGHSMGAHVAALVAAEHPERVQGVVLVDGGLPFEADVDVAVDEALAKTLGPALARLEISFGSVDEYVRFWQAHPAFAGPWTDDLDAFVRADLAGESGALRSVVSAAAVRTDGAALLRDDATRTAAERVRAPLHVLRAPRGLLDDDRVLVPDSVLVPFLARHPEATAELVEDCNHYTILMRDGAARVAAAIVRAAPVGSDRPTPRHARPKSHA